ncbi:hypothetical protein D3C80_959660 [compost metagenome]
MSKRVERPSSFLRIWAANWAVVSTVARDNCDRPRSREALGAAAGASRICCGGARSAGASSGRASAGSGGAATSLGAIAVDDGAAADGVAAGRIDRAPEPAPASTLASACAVAFAALEGRSSRRAERLRAGAGVASSGVCGAASASGSASEAGVAAAEMTASVGSGTTADCAACEGAGAGATGCGAAVAVGRAVGVAAPGGATSGLVEATGWNAGASV